MPLNPMAEIVHQDDQLDVLIGGKSISVIDAADDYVLAECELAELDGERAGTWPKELVLQIHSTDGFGTYFFHELHIVANDDSVALDFVCHTPNKYWEGHYGLAAFIQALSEQVDVSENLDVTHMELEDDWKAITLRRGLCIGDPIVPSIQNAAQTLTALIRQAEIALGGMAWKAAHAENEDLFCREILLPLLRRMGFLFVRYTHGRREYGKDFTFSEQSRFGGLRHYGLQAKAGDVSGGVNSQIDELVGQIDDAFSMPFYELGSNDRRFISMFVIAISGYFTENAREKIVEKISDSLLGSVWFLDRTRIDELIERYWRPHNRA